MTIVRTAVFAALLLFVLNAAATAQPDTTSATALTIPSASGEKYAIGGNIGLLSGAGISGQVFLTPRVSVQPTFFVITLGDYFHFNMGGEIQYHFTRDREGGVYSLLGAGYYHSTTSDTSKPGNRVANPFRFGLGLGYEWFTSRNFAFSIAAAIHYFPYTSEFLPLPEFGMYYYFN
ncbi:MAG: hypothetical protein JNJ94_11740 [Chlorobi bacterium]|nr:hypothetical protein [Chlorobiota bacterium]